MVPGHPERLATMDLPTVAKLAREIRARGRGRRAAAIAYALPRASRSGALVDSDRPTSRDQARREDEDLIQSCIAGDPRAWERFVDRFGRLVYAVPSRMGLQPEACEDVFQNVFAIVLRELPRVRDAASIPKWLITIAHHESYRWVRRWKHRGEGLPAGAELPEPDPDPAEDELDRLERQQIILDAVDQLDGRCRELLTLLFLDPAEPSYQEIAKRLGMAVGAIGPTRNRCLRKLLETLGDRLE
jgi:RNA polymerase sigma factor (sigma-70 family)